MTEILEIAIGLIFVYLLLALIASALNEYLAAIFNRRGRFLYDGIVKLLRQTGVDSPDDFFKHPLIASLFGASAGRDRLPGGKEAVSVHGGTATDQAEIRRRTPSYLPARTFAMALLDLKDRGWKLPEGKGIDAIIDVLKKDAPQDVAEFVGRPDVAKALAAANISVDDLKARAQAEVEKIHDSVEVWFNNAMDRVSGAYKRYTHVLLFLLGFGAAAALNADTFQIWRNLSENDALRTKVAEQVATTMANPQFVELATRPPTPQDSANADSARARIEQAQKVLAGTDLKLGWTSDDWDALRHGWAWLWKLFGLLVTGVAVSFGAPFWFDMLNKIIAIRLAGRAPDEKPKNPEGGPKRAAEAAPK